MENGVFCKERESCNECIALFATDLYWAGGNWGFLGRDWLQFLSCGFPREKLLYRALLIGRTLCWTWMGDTWDDPLEGLVTGCLCCGGEQCRFAGGGSQGEDLHTWSEDGGHLAISCSQSDWNMYGFTQGHSDGFPRYSFRISGMFLKKLSSFWVLWSSMFSSGRHSVSSWWPEAGVPSGSFIGCFLLPDSKDVRVDLCCCCVCRSAASWDNRNSMMESSLPPLLPCNSSDEAFERSPPQLELEHRDSGLCRSDACAGDVDVDSGLDEAVESGGEIGSVAGTLSQSSAGAGDVRSIMGMSSEGWLFEVDRQSGVPLCDEESHCILGEAAFWLCSLNFGDVDPAWCERSEGLSIPLSMLYRSKEVLSAMADSSGGGDIVRKSTSHKLHARATISTCCSSEASLSWKKKCKSFNYLTEFNRKLFLKSGKKI